VLRSASHLFRGTLSNPMVGQQTQLLVMLPSAAFGAGFPGFSRLFSPAGKSPSDNLYTREMPIRGCEIFLSPLANPAGWQKAWQHPASSMGGF